MPLVFAIIFGIGLGLASGGDIHGLKRIPLDHPVIFITLFAIQGAARGRTFGDGWGYAGVLIWEVTAFVLVLFLVLSGSVNAKVLGLGMLLNLLVVLVYGFMPVSSGAEQIAKSTSDPFYMFLGSTSPSVLAVFGDVIPLHLMHASYFLSIGDILMFVGVIGLVMQSMLSSGSCLGKPDMGSQV